MTQPDCPDVLGAITDARTVIGNQLQCAVGIYPEAAVLNQPVELLILLQSAIDSALDVTVKVHMPLKDRNGNDLKFDLPSTSFTKTLESLEVGVVHLPIYATDPTPEDQDYPVIVEIKIAPVADATIVRPVSGGRAPSILNVSHFLINVLRDVNFSANVRKPGQLTAMIHLVSGKFPLESNPAQPKYDTLWTMLVLDEEMQAAEEIKPQALQFSGKLTTPDILVPLRNMTLEKYAAANFPLHGGEATMIAKLLVYVLGDGLKTEDGFSLEDARWFRNLCHLMVSDANITAQPRQVFDRLYPDIIYDAVILGLSICSTHLDIDVGDDTERRGYAEEVRDAFAPQHKMNISYVYLPLVMAGITLNQRVRLREEPVSGNISQVKEAVQGRKALSGDTYNEIFELTEQIIQHAEKSLKAD